MWMLLRRLGAELQSWAVVGRFYSEDVMNLRLFMMFYRHGWRHFQEWRIVFGQLWLFLIRASLQQHFHQRLHMLTEANSNQWQIPRLFQRFMMTFLIVFNLTFIFNFILSTHVNIWSLYIRESESLIWIPQWIYRWRKRWKTHLRHDELLRLKTPTEILYHYRYIYNRDSNNLFRMSINWNISTMSLVTVQGLIQKYTWTTCARGWPYIFDCRMIYWFVWGL